MNVLVVEDDFINRKLFQAILEKRGGYQVKFSEDPIEILDLAEKKSVDVIIMDVALANSMYQGESIDGLHISRLLKGNSKTNGIPIILATAHAMKGQGENFLKLSGANDYLPKPIINPDDLINKIRAWVKE